MTGGREGRQGFGETGVLIGWAHGKAFKVRSARGTDRRLRPVPQVRGELKELGKSQSNLPWIERGIQSESGGLRDGPLFFSPQSSICAQLLFICSFCPPCLKIVLHCGGLIPQFVYLCGQTPKRFHYSSFVWGSFKACFWNVTSRKRYIKQFPAYSLKLKDT